MDNATMPSRPNIIKGIEEYGQKVEQLLCMNGGQGETSYANNSILQRKVMSGARHVLEESLMEICKTFSSTESLAIADLGCATGPNALLAISEIVGIVSMTFDDMGLKSPSFLAFLNDLPSNDFNTVFSSLAGFYDPLRRVGRECFLMAVPGSFYGRLFPSKSLHFVHSSNAIHWISQVPKGLIGENGQGLNKGNICIAETSSVAVHKAFAEQFEEDLNVFLKARFEELRPDGSMVLTFLVSDRSNASFKMYEVIGQTLYQMAQEGLIKESTLDSFELPFYAASIDQITKVIVGEGSFKIRILEAFKIGWDAGMGEEDECASRGEFVAKYLRAAVEPLLVVSFGQAVMDELFERAAVKFEELMNAGDCHYDNVVVWLTRNVFV